MPPPSAPAPTTTPPIGSLVPVALLGAAFVLAVASRGDVVVLTLLLGLGAGRRDAGLAAAGALGAAMVRWGSPSLAAIAGAQAVLGPAGWTGSRAAVASAWFGAIALVLAARPMVSALARPSALTAAPFAAAAADVVIGPAPGGALALRVLATVAAFAVIAATTRWPRLPMGAELCAVIALVCAGVAR